jgi:hypothetical protein
MRSAQAGMMLALLNQLALVVEQLRRQVVSEAAETPATRALVEQDWVYQRLGEDPKSQALERLIREYGFPVVNLGGGRRKYDPAQVEEWIAQGGQRERVGRWKPTQDLTVAQDERDLRAA